MMRPDTKQLIGWALVVVALAFLGFCALTPQHYRNYLQSPFAKGEAGG